MSYVVELAPDYEKDRNHRSYLFRHPATGEVVTGDNLDNPYCHPPAHFALEEAERRAEEMNVQGPLRGWRTHVAPSPCPSCAREMWANDLDFCYPNNRRRSYRAGCNVHDFGCGFEIEGNDYEDAILKWNSAALFDYKGRAHSRVEGKGLAVLKTELEAVFAGYPEYHDPSRGLGTFDAMVRKFSEDEFYHLHFVAKHYLWLLSPKKT